MLDITAKLKKVIWRSLENDFTIAAFLPEAPDKSEFIATGDLFKPSENIIYSLSGEWTDHPKYGKQFKIDSYCVQAPADASGIAAYLEKYINGIGPVLADKLIEKYGENTIRILKGAPERVSDENSGISYNLALKIQEQLKEDDLRQDILVKLEGLFSKVKGLPKRLAGDLLNMYGLTAYEAVKSKPYEVLMGMNRVGFLSADKVALAGGMKNDDPERIKAGIVYVVKMTMQESGDGWLSHKEIINGLIGIVNIKEAYILKHIGLLVADGVLVDRNGFVTLAVYDEDESTIADCVGRFLI